MESNEYDEVIVDDVADYNEQTEEVVEEAPKAEKPKRTPEEEYEYHMGRANRLAKKLGKGSEEKSEPVVRSSSTDKPGELSDGQIAILRTEGIKSKAELALFTEVMAETGKGVLDLLDSNYFKSRLADFRDSQETMNAIPKGKNRSGQTGISDTDVAFAEFQKTGAMPEDFKSRIAIKNKLVEAEKNNSMFSGPSVIGPQGQQY